MKQFKLTFVLTVLMSMVGLQAFAVFDTSTKVEVGGLYYYLDNDNSQAQVTSMPEGYYSGDIEIIPNIKYGGKTYSVKSIGEMAFYNCSGLTSVAIGKRVSSIGESAFSGCSGLTSVTLNSNDIASKAYTSSNNIKNIFGEQVKEYIIGEDVTSIGAYAFDGCSKLTSVTIGNSVTSIGDYAFQKCSGLTSVTIGNSVTSIGAYAFDGCSKLTSVTIGNSVTSIGDYAFQKCSGLTSVTIGNSVTSIGRYVFYNCSSLTSVTIGNSVTSINSSAFQNCSDLTSVTLKSNAIVSKTYRYDINLKNFFGEQVTEYIIGDDVTSIGDNAFYGCTGLTSVTIGNSVTSIGGNAFRECSKLTSVTIGNSVTSIGGYAFYLCSGLTSVTIPNSVTSIGGRAFRDCSGLTSVTIGNSVTSIDDYAFYRCSGLKKVIVKDIAAWCGISFKHYDENPLYYAKHLYSDENTEIKDLVIPDGVTNIGEYTFYNCSWLTSVTIGNSVTSIDESAFNGCSGLKKVIVKDIAAWCKMSFSNEFANPLYYAKHLYSDENTEVKDLVIPDGVTSIGSYAFLNCSGLTSVTIPNSVTSIGFVAFAGCSGLTSVTIPNSVTSIHENAFSGCSGLTSVTIPNSVTSIENSAFKDCSGLKKVIVKDIAAWCKISFGSSSANPLYNAKHLYSDENTEITDLVIPDGVTSIGAGAFYNCDGLTSVTIPNSVTSFGGSAFRDCSNLESVTALNPTPVTINQNTFTNRENATLYVPKGSKDAYKAANYWKEFMEIVEIDVTAISSVTNEQKVTEVTRYNLQGRRTSTPERGINIIRMSDGTTRKVLVK